MTASLPDRKTLSRLADVSELRSREHRYMQTCEDVVARWREAEAIGDVASLDTLLGADFRGDSAGGNVLSKEQWLDRHRSGDLFKVSIDWRPPDIRDTGRTPVASSTHSKVAYCRGEDRTGEVLYTLVAAHRDGRWTIVNLQFSRRLRAGRV